MRADSNEELGIRNFGAVIADSNEELGISGLRRLYITLRITVSSLSDIYRYDTF